MWFIIIFVFAVISRIIFEEVEFGSEDLLYGYSFTDIFRSIDTMWITMLMENFPDILFESF